jgi:hypothetical protein
MGIHPCDAVLDGDEVQNICHIQSPDFPYESYGFPLVNPHEVDHTPFY